VAVACLWATAVAFCERRLYVARGGGVVGRCHPARGRFTGWVSVTRDAPLRLGLPLVVRARVGRALLHASKPRAVCLLLRYWADMASLRLRKSPRSGCSAV
jgi:hypothetical protein